MPHNRIHPRNHSHNNVSSNADCSNSWESASNGQVPLNAVVGGRDASGETYFIGRVRHDEHHLIPGKVQPSHNCIYYPHHGEKRQNTYEVLVNRNPNQIFSWVSSSGHNIPVNAVEGGRQKQKPVYIGKHWHEGALVVGKVLPSHNCLYIPYGGKEANYKDYEILVVSYAAMTLSAPTAMPYTYAAYSNNYYAPPYQLGFAPAAPAVTNPNPSIYPHIGTATPAYGSVGGYNPGYVGGRPPPYK